MKIILFIAILDLWRLSLQKNLKFFTENEKKEIIFRNKREIYLYFLKYPIFSVIRVELIDRLMEKLLGNQFPLL